MATLETLVSFNGADGKNPQGSLIVDANGDLFGTTPFGGTGNNGTIFELVPGLIGGGYSLSELSFNGTDGMTPFGGLIADVNGDLFGTTEDGGPNGEGTVFELAKSATGYASAPIVLESFAGYTQFSTYEPAGGLLADARGDLFGTTLLGRANNTGTIFELSPAVGGEALSQISSISFGGTYPTGNLIADANGDLFGTTEDGGLGGLGAGTVFEIAKTATGDATPTILVTFNITNGGEPLGALIADASGDLFGTTEIGGAGGSGTVFEIAKTAAGYATAPTELVSFATGQYPEGGLTADAHGDLFGTTNGGGASGDGTVFEITGSGYVVAPCFCRGTRILTARGEMAVEDLQPGETVVLADGGAAPVVWIGRRRVAAAEPVRVRAYAFGRGLPQRDLLVSPDHALLVDGGLVPAELLVDGCAIVREHHALVTYYHVELERHAVLLAEGLPAESYLDTGNRRQFANAPLVELRPAFGLGDEQAEPCAPMVLGGPLVETIRERLGRSDIEQAA